VYENIIRTSPIWVYFSGAHSIQIIDRNKWLITSPANLFLYPVIIIDVMSVWYSSIRKYYNDIVVSGDVIFI